MKKTLLLMIFWSGMLLLHPLYAQDDPEDKKPILVNFSKLSGFYNQTIAVSLSTENLPIYFTKDGSKPSERSERYNGKPIVIDKTTVLRAIARKGDIRSKTFTQTYFINEPTTKMPIVSVSINPSVLFDSKKGIMRTGPDADLEKANIPGANFWTRKEFACNVEIFEDDKRCVHNSLSGLRIFGGYSRVFPQKSIVLVARKKYGKKYFKHKIFGENDIKKHKYLVMRNGGSDCLGAHFRDELMTELTEGWDIEKQAYRPALLYLNGQYWGVYHIREKINARFLQDHTDADKDSLDLLEHKQTVREGSFDRYERLLKYIETHDLARQECYTKVQSMMDVENYCDLQIAQIYCNNTDAGGNIRYWRAHRSGARWRWILFDTDWGFGLHDPSSYKDNTLDFFTDENGPSWPNPPWSTFLLRNLLKNSDFQTLFVNRLCDRLNTSFSEDNALAAINKFEQILAPEMPRQFTRWEQPEEDWKKHLQTLRNFVTKRPTYLREFFTERFNTGEMAGIEIEKPEGGAIMLNRCLRIEKSGFTGHYFENFPVHLQAIPDFGYKFAGWEGIDATGRIVTTRLRTDATLHLKARFVPYEHPLHDQIFINEICSFNKKTGDWIELYNKSKETIHLEGWTLTDRRNEYTFPDVSLQPDHYLVVCQDIEAFRSQFPVVTNICGSFGFGLDKAAERLALYAPDGAAVDSVYYRVEPQENTYTIDLLLQHLDNANNSNWSVHDGTGSPGTANPLYLAQVISAKKDLSIRIGLGIALLLVAAMAIWKRK